MNRPELSNGTLYFNARVENTQVSERQHIWVVPSLLEEPRQVYRYQRVDLVDPQVDASLLRLGGLLLFANPSDAWQPKTKGRRYFRIRRSYQGGKTWTVNKLMTTAFTGYSAMRAYGQSVGLLYESSDFLAGDYETGKANDVLVFTTVHKGWFTDSTVAAFEFDEPSGAVHSHNNILYGNVAVLHGNRTRYPAAPSITRDYDKHSGHPEAAAARLRFVSSTPRTATFRWSDDGTVWTAESEPEGPHAVSWIFIAQRKVTQPDAQAPDAKCESIDTESYFFIKQPPELRPGCDIVLRVLCRRRSCREPGLRD